MTAFSSDDAHLFAEGTHRRLYERLGAHLEGDGVRFAVWAPNAERVFVIGDFNGWRPGVHPLQRTHAGVFEGRVAGVRVGAHYKFQIEHASGYRVAKADPFARATEPPPRTASIVAREQHVWHDAAWMEGRAARHVPSAPLSIYECHLGSWQRPAPGQFFGYRELAPRLASHVKRLGFTHVELLPVMEHPFYGSWGYQVTSYFAPTARHGGPDDLRALVDHLHGEGIGVILDWVPAHFPSDEHGPGFFDGTHLYEPADPKRGFHPDWKSLIFDYGRGEVQSFLTSSALFWLKSFHADGLRVDGVASMLYHDYSRKHGEWIPNQHGGRENLEAIELLRRVNNAVHEELGEGPTTIAEESTAWPMVSRPTWVGGLGFGFKWDMGWMHDALAYFQLDPIHRRFHHDKLTFRGLYAFSESFVLPLSHDEVVHGKGSLYGKMPGDDWQKRANLRLLWAWQWVQPGKKLLFQGAELGSPWEWNHDGEVPWHLRERPAHAGLEALISDLNRLYVSEPSMHEQDCDARGFEWVDCNDAEHSVVSLLRLPKEAERCVLAVFNFTPVPRDRYRVGVPVEGAWTEILNTDAPAYGGSGIGNLGVVQAEALPHHGRPASITMRLPPLGALFFRSPPLPPKVAPVKPAELPPSGPGAATPDAPQVPTPGEKASVPAGPTVPSAPTATAGAPTPATGATRPGGESK